MMQRITLFINLLMVVELGIVQELLPRLVALMVRMVTWQILLLQMKTHLLLVKFLQGSIHGLLEMT